jgi:small subunit ribosomal protein S13
MIVPALYTAADGSKPAKIIPFSPMYIGKKRLNSNISIRRALVQLSGIGSFLANQICDQLGFAYTLRLKDLQYFQQDRLLHILNEYYIFDIQLRIRTKQNIKRLLQIKSYRGHRFRDGLPVRGQRTHTNAQTCRSRKR